MRNWPEQHSRLVEIYDVSCKQVLRIRENIPLRFGCSSVRRNTQKAKLCSNQTTRVRNIKAANKTKRCGEEEKSCSKKKANEAESKHWKKALEDDKLGRNHDAC